MSEDQTHQRGEVSEILRRWTDEAFMSSLFDHVFDTVASGLVDAGLDWHLEEMAKPSSDGQRKSSYSGSLGKHQ